MNDFQDLWTMTREEMISEMISLDEHLSEREDMKEGSIVWLRELEEDEFSAEYEEVTGNVVFQFNDGVFEIY